jgi:cytidylate kinase
MIVTIDGPAGAGKSSIARALAQRLGFRFLDTGAMYRAVAWVALQRNIDLQDRRGLAQLARGLDLVMSDDTVLVDGKDVSEDIRSAEVTQAVRFVADNLEVRQHLSVLQQQIAAGGRIVTEGRDQGTVVFPHAQCKFFLTASPEERAKRRYCELVERGVTTTYEDVLAQQTQRDHQDAERPVGGLLRADDAIEVCTDGVTPEQVLDQLAEIVRQRAEKTPRSPTGTNPFSGSTY